MNKISQSILHKIQQENIKPKARWYFILEHIALWIPGVIVTALGALAVAGMLYAAAHSGWEYNEFIYPSKMEFLLAAAPFLWIISFIVFNSLIVKALRTTHLGYRLSVKRILLGSVTASVVIGTSGYIVDEMFKANSIIRYPVRMREEQVWSSPQKGRISGRIEKKYETSIVLRDKDNVLWSIDMSGFGSTTFPFVKEGESLRILGTSTNEVTETEDEESKEHSFVACAVFPWEIGEPNRKPLIKPHPLREARNRMQNKNPDCKTLLEEMKKSVRFGERK